MVESYEYIDGSEGKLKIVDSRGNPIEYKDPVAVFKNKDPRFFGTIIYPFSKWRGNTIEIRRGIVDGSKILISGESNDLYKGFSVGRKGILASYPEILKHTFAASENRVLVIDNHAMNFLNAIKNNTPTVSPIESAVRSDTISHLCNMLVRSGKPLLKWDPASETLVDADEDTKSLLSRAS